MSAQGTVLVYRDRLGQASETGFLARQYVGFTRLRPVWIGRRVGAGAAALPGDTLRLGGEGPWGAVRRLGFRFGLVGAAPLIEPRPLLVHAQFARGGALALPLAEATGLPLVVTLHGGDIAKAKNWQGGVLAKRWPRLIERAAGFVCVSQHLALLAEARGVPSELLFVQPIGAPLGQAASAARAPDAPFLFVGRLVEKKGIVDLLAAFARLRAGGAPARLVVLGDGPLRAAVDEAAAADPAIEAHGWADAEAVRSAMAEARALVVPSRVAANGDVEGLPSVVVEAMACATPMIGTRHGGIPEAVTDGVTGFLVPEGDVAALAAAMGRLLGDPGEAEALGGAGRALAEQRFDATSCSEALETLLLRLAGHA